MDGLIPSEIDFKMLFLALAFHFAPKMQVIKSLAFLENNKMFYISIIEIKTKNDKKQLQMFHAKEKNMLS